MNHRRLIATTTAVLGLTVATPSFGDLYFLELVGPVDVEIDDPYGAEIGDEITVRYTFDDSIITEQLFVDWLPGVDPYLAGNAYLMTDIELRLNGDIIHTGLANPGQASLLFYDEFPAADGHETGQVLIADGTLISVSSHFGTAVEWLTSLDPADNIGITPWEELTPGGGYHYDAAIQTAQWIIRYFPETYEIGTVDTGCSTDLNGDGATGFADLTQVLNTWGACAKCVEDLNGDGSVGFADLTTLLNTWGPCDA